MKQETLAPWAESVPDVPYPLTTDDLLTLPDDGWQYELVEGRLVRMPPSGGEASAIALDLAGELRAYVKPRKLGRVTGADGTFDLTKPDDANDTDLAPDAAFVRADRVPPRDSADYKRAWRLAPDLVAEVASPSQYRPEMRAKALLYLAAGVQLVWVVWPKRREVDVWLAGSDKPVATLKVGDVLDGLHVLPGFTYPLTELFE